MDNPVIDKANARAIREEIGERLKTLLKSPPANDNFDDERHKLAQHSEDDADQP
jgi:hypothetical protein